MRNPAIINALEQSLSRERLNKYLIDSNDDLDAAIGLYERNTRFAEAFYAPLQAMEVCLRNSLDRELAGRYGADWLFNGSPPFQEDSADRIQRTVDGFRYRRRVATHGAVLADLSFGFWVSLIGTRYDDTLWRFAIFRAFSDFGRRMNRQRVHGRFNALRRFRNRVAHHEPIFHKDLPKAHDEIIESIRWLCPHTSAWANHQSRFAEVFAAT